MDYEDTPSSAQPDDRQIEIPYLSTVQATFGIFNFPGNVVFPTDCNCVDVGEDIPSSLFCLPRDMGFPVFLILLGSIYYGDVSWKSLARRTKMKMAIRMIPETVGDEGS